MSIRLLVITSAFPNFAGDPRGTFIDVLVRSLVRRGVEVTVLAPGSVSAPAHEVLDGFEVHRATYWIPCWQGLADGLGGIVPNLRKRPWLAVQVLPLLGAMAWKATALARRADLIHAHWAYPAGIAGLVAARWRRLPLIVTSHGGDLNLAKRSRTIHWIASRVGKSADFCIGVSHAMVHEFHRLGVPRPRVRFIPLGVDVGGPSANNGRGLEALRRFEGFRIVYVGSLIPGKSVDTLLHAHQRLESQGFSVATIIVGDGPSESALRRLAARNGSTNVFFAGRQPPECVPSSIGAADVLVLPSLAEGRGLVIVQAMAMGRPVISSDIPGPAELVRHGENGFLFPARDDEALASCIAQLITNPELRERMGRRGRAMVAEEGLTPGRCAARHMELYEEALEK